MPDMQEVFRMATQKVRPEPGFVDRQHRTQRRKKRNGRIGGVTYVARATEGGPEIVHVAGVGGSNIQAFEATESPDSAQGPSWSPDGSTIVYQAKGEGTVGNLFLLDVASGDVRQLTDLEPVAGDFSFWPMTPTFISGGGEVVFVWPTPTGTGDDVRGDLWAVPVTGGEPTRIRRNAGFVDASPDGTRISFNEFGIVDGGITTVRLWLSDATVATRNSSTTGASR